MHEDMTIPFVLFSDRLSQIEIYHDFLKDLEFYNHISSFEVHVFGVVNQYQRIQEVLKRMMSPKKESLTSRNNDHHQVKLDIYYFILTMDKLKKIFKLITTRINKIIRELGISKDFVRDYRLIRRRIDHVFREYDDSARNEYEHPSLKFQRKGNMMLFGNMLFSGTDVSVHVSGDVNVTIKKLHVERLGSLRIELMDLFIKHFSKKMLIHDLLKHRDEFINDIEKNIKEYKKIIQSKNHELSSKLFSTLLLTETFFSTEGIPLPNTIHEKIYKAIWYDQKNIHRMIGIIKDRVNRFIHKTFICFMTNRFSFINIKNRLKGKIQ